MTDEGGRPGIVTGAFGLALLAVLALLAPWLTGDPTETDLTARLAGPSAAHLLGCDTLGRDVLARIVHGARISLVVATAVVAISLTAGVLVGAVAGWAGGWTDEVIGRLIDVLLAFPGLLLAIALAAILGPTLPNVVLALSVLGWTGYARLTRTQVDVLRARDFVGAARALGVRPARIVTRHLLPLVAPLLLVQATFGLSAAILAEASLSFLGLGAAPPTPSWGAMLDEGRTFMFVAPHLVVAPGAALAATVTCLQLLGDGLRDRLDVQSGFDQAQR
jgi:peptide/nickel transport system permease protein